MSNIKIWNISKKAPEECHVPSGWKNNPTFVYCGRAVPRMGMEGSILRDHYDKDFMKFMHPDHIDFRRGAIHGHCDVIKEYIENELNLRRVEV